MPLQGYGAVRSAQPGGLAVLPVCSGRHLIRSAAFHTTGTHITGRELESGQLATVCLQLAFLWGLQGDIPWLKWLAVFLL